MSQNQRQKIRELVLRYGRNATCYQVVNPVFEYQFFDEFDAVVAYVRASRRRVVAGAPIGPVDRISEVARRFESLESAPVLYFGAGDPFLASTAQSDSSVAALGAQPVWIPKHWKSENEMRPSLRYQLHRAINKGVTVREWGTGEAENSAELHEVLDSWLRGRGLPPLHFLVEPETLGYLSDRRTFVASQDGKPVAFLNLCPVPMRNGWLTEQFPRLESAPNGTVELLMDFAARTVAREGADYLTMGLVPLSVHAAIEQNPRWLRRTMRLARDFGSPLYSFRGLEEFKDKFRPEYWEPIYAVTPNRTFRFGDLLAVAEAFAGEPAIATLGRVIRRRLSQR
ncbi:MAG: DUF2156 domain-containing protein [Fimbriimonadaceae bacterium]|nr:DUF2156 domain-containing protein [Fimbriimonadaceae bacterium]